MDRGNRQSKASVHGCDSKQTGKGAPCEWNCVECGILEVRSVEQGMRLVECQSRQFCTRPGRRGKVWIGRSLKGEVDVMLNN